MHQRRLLRSIPLITLLLIATACSASPAPITTPPPAPADAAQLAPSVPVVTATSRVPTEQATTSPLAPSIAPATPALTATLAPSGPATIPYRLPLDQPWFLLSDDHLIAISRAGGWTLFDPIVTAVIARPGAPPLLATVTRDGVPALVDPRAWTERRLALKPANRITKGLLSPDGTRVILQVHCVEDAQCVDGARDSNQIVDLRTGAMRRADTIPVPFFGPYDSVMDAYLLGWGAQGVYYGTAYNRAGPTALGVADPADAQPSARTLLSNTAYVLDSANDLLVAMYSTPVTDTSASLFRYSGEMRLELSDLRHGATQTIDRATAFSPPAIAPDGTALAYFRIEQDQSDVHIPPHFELVRFDIVENTKTVLSDTLGAPVEIYALGAQNKAIFWSHDSQRLIATVVSKDGAQAVLLARDGPVINTSPLPLDILIGVTSDDQLALEQQNGRVLHWLPLRPNTTPYSADVPVPNILISSAQFAPEDSARLPARSTAVNVPPATQLPPPRVPTPLP